MVHFVITIIIVECNYTQNMLISKHSEFVKCLKLFYINMYPKITLLIVYLFIYL